MDITHRAVGILESANPIDISGRITNAVPYPAIPAA
jgi:hypothetical protein